MGGIAAGKIFSSYSEPDQLAPSRKEEQLAYLKEHKQEIVDLVKSQNPKVESVQIKWKYTYWSKGYKMTSIYIYGGFNYLEDSGWGIEVLANIEDGSIEMDSMRLIDDLIVGSEYFE